MTTRSRRDTLSPLTDEQKSRLERIISGGPEALQPRARIILLADQDHTLSTAAMASRLGVSPTTVRRWMRRFQTDGMAIFEVASVATAPPAEQPASVQPAEPEQPRPCAPEGAISLEALAERYSVDQAHVAHVARLARRLFDATAGIHRQPPDSWRLLEAAALLHDMAYDIDPEQHHLLVRDILLGQPLIGFTEDERRMLACITAFHRKKARPGKEPAFARLKKSRQRATLALAALLRIADGLDYSHTQTCTIASVTVVDGALRLAVEGAYADFNGARAEKMADLWEDQFGIPVRAREERGAEAGPESMMLAELEPGLDMPEAGRFLLGHYLMLVEQHADRLREGADENLTYLERDLSRLQDVYRMFGEYFDTTALAGFKKEVRWLHQQAYEALTARAVAVMTRADDPNVAPDEELTEARQAVVEAQGAEASRAMSKLRKTLDSRRYRRFLAGLLGFSRHAGAGVFPGARGSERIGTQAALLAWQEYTRLRVEGRADGDVQAQWRRVRRFHNVLQCLGSLLGSELGDVLSVVQPLETQLRDIMLGEAVPETLAQTLLAHDTGKGKKGKKQQALLAGVIDRVADGQQAWLRDARQQADSRWATLDSADFRRKLALAVAAP